MAGRRSVWSSENIIRASAAFVPVTDEVWRLQRGTDAECKHFQKMANQGHYKAEGGTRQGIYVMTASGKLLASINARNGEQVLAMMQRGLEAWQTTTKAERTLPEGFTMPRRRWETSYPADGLVLRSWNVDLAPGADRARRNIDHAWFSADEARGWLGQNLAVGAKHPVSKSIVERLACFHLVDNIRGQTLPFAPVETAGSKLQTTVTAVQDGVIAFRIEGETVAKTDGTWKFPESDWKPKDVYPRSVTTKVLGSGRYDTAKKRFTHFEFVALGERTGRTNLCGRAKGDLGPAGIGFYFELAPKRASSRVPPAFIDIYGAAWVVDPR